MPKVKFTLDGTRGLIQELVPDDNPSELTVNNLDRSVYARRDYVDNAIANISGSGGGNVSLTGSNIFGSSISNTHQFTGSVILNNGITGSLLGTSSFASDTDKLDGLDSTAFAKLGSINTFSADQTINGNLTVNGTASINLLSIIFETSSVIFTSGSTKFGNSADDTHQFTGSVILNNGITGSLLGTSSFALTASSINGLNTNNIARTDTGNTFNGNQIITGSLNVSQGITGSLTGATVSATNLNGIHVNVDYIDFNTSASSPPSFQTGRLYFDQTTADLQYNTNVSPNSVNLGQQSVLKVKNTTNATINKGKLVRISGGQGANPLISTASYENDNNSANTLGMVMNNIAHNDFGYVLLEGVLSALNLDPDPPKSYVAGQVLYLSSSGDYTNVAPTAPKHAVRIGEVIRAHQNEGVAFIRIQNGYELNELHDVLITSASNGDLLTYNNSSSLWINSKNLSGSYGLSGSINISQGITGSITGSLGLFTTLTGSNISASIVTLGSSITQNNQATTKQYVDIISTNLALISGSLPRSTVVVSEDGSDSNIGSFMKPLRTINAALSKLDTYISGGSGNADNHAVVLICPGTYSENITIQHKNVTLRGLTEDREDQAVTIVGSITIHATASRGRNTDSISIQNLKLNDLSTSTRHLISLTGSAPSASGVTLGLKNVIVAKVNSASSNASGLFCDTTFTNKIRIVDSRFLDQNGGGSPLIHLKSSSSVDIFDCKLETTTGKVNVGPLISIEGNCQVTACDRTVLDSYSASGSVFVNTDLLFPTSILTSLVMSNSSIVQTANFTSDGIKFAKANIGVFIGNVFTVLSGASNSAISGTVGSIVSISNNVSTSGSSPAFTTRIAGSSKVNYLPIT
jgi:hypothetical protein